jgi:hypothetical protein
VLLVVAVTAEHKMVAQVLVEQQTQAVAVQVIQILGPLAIHGAAEVVALA